LKSQLQLLITTSEASTAVFLNLQKMATSEIKTTLIEAPLPQSVDMKNVQLDDYHLFPGP